MVCRRFLKSLFGAVVLISLVTTLKIVWNSEWRTRNSVKVQGSWIRTDAPQKIAVIRDTASELLQSTEKPKQVDPDERWKNATHRLAVIIPFRDREAHLAEFTKHIVPFLKKQGILFHVYIIEQTGDGLFNRGKLSNIGFLVAKERDYDYVCFHDVDMLPLNEKNQYSYPQSNPHHLATCVQQFDYKLPFAWYNGGVVSFTMDQYQKINGMSNVYFGWGKEDDDLYRRITSSGYKLERQEPASGPDCIGRYKSLDHGPRDYSSTKRNNQLLSRGRERQSTDGLNSVKYKKVKEDFVSRWCTRILVNICMEVVLVSADAVGCNLASHQPHPG
eukprot:m.9744 g.9744  ORF g.9744 m.9744 type:complete len:331 (+) comp21601_c0_seq1:314-1306(+)